MSARSRTEPQLEAPALGTPRGIARWLGSWTASICFHVALLWGVYALADLWRVKPMGIDADDGREVSIYVKPASSDAAEQSPSDAAAENETDRDAVEEAAVAEAAVPDEPPVDIALPEMDTDVPLLGGSPQEATSASTLPESLPLRSNGESRQPGEGRKPSQTAQFFGAEARGEKFVYVVDCSGSMAKHNALGEAKRELLASLQSLDRDQKFQVIFYNQRTAVFQLRGESSPRLYWATDLHRTQARQFVAGIVADLGTDHMPAIREALKLHPEVVFLLTDADEPILSAADLDEIQRLSKGETQFHAIEFGRGPPLTLDNFLKKLSRMTGGTYRYVDVTRLSRR